MGEETFFEIVLFLAEKFSEIYPQKWELDEVTDFLRELGYENTEIKRALSWFFLQVEPDTHETVPTASRRSSNGFRILSPQEMNRITPEAHGYLIRLRRLGVIDDDGLEDVMENAMEMGDDVIDRDDLIQIINRVVQGLCEEDLNKAREMCNEEVSGDS